MMEPFVALLLLFASSVVCATDPYGATIHTSEKTVDFVKSVGDVGLSVTWDREEIISATAHSTYSTTGSVPGCTFDLDVFYTTIVENCELLSTFDNIPGSITNSFGAVTFDFHFNETSERPYEFTFGTATIRAYLDQTFQSTASGGYKVKVVRREGPRAVVNVWHPVHGTWYYLRMLLDDGTRSISQSVGGLNPVTTCGSLDIDKNLITWNNYLPGASLYWEVMARDPTTSPTFNTSSVPENGIPINVYDVSSYDMWGKDASGLDYFSLDSTFTDPEVPRMTYAGTPVNRQRYHMNRTTVHNGAYIVRYGDIRTIKDGVILDSRYRTGMIYHLSVRVAMTDQQGRSIPFEGYFYRCSYPFASPHGLGQLPTVSSGPGGELDTTVSFTVAPDMAVSSSSGPGRCTSWSFKFTSIGIDGRASRHLLLNQEGLMLVATTHGYAVPMF